MSHILVMDISVKMYSYMNFCDALSVTVIVEGNGIGDPSSIPGKNLFAFLFGVKKKTCERHDSICLPPAMSKLKSRLNSLDLLRQTVSEEENSLYFTYKN